MEELLISASPCHGYAVLPGIARLLLEELPEDLPLVLEQTRKVARPLHLGARAGFGPEPDSEVIEVRSGI